MTMNDRNIGKIAFWNYSHYPHILWGEITAQKDRMPGTTYPNHVEVKGYGHGFWFNPIAILPKETAQPFIDKFKALTNERATELDIVYTQFDGELKPVRDTLEVWMN